MPVVLNSRNYKDLCFSPHKKKGANFMACRAYPAKVVSGLCSECRFVVDMPR